MSNPYQFRVSVRRGHPELSLVSGVIPDGDYDIVGHEHPETKTREIAVSHSVRGRVQIRAGMFHEVPPIETPAPGVPLKSFDEDEPHTHDTAHRAKPDLRLDDTGPREPLVHERESHTAHGHTPPHH